MPLGLILKNENVANDMIEIMRELHQYVPAQHQIFFGGDQLTCERSRNSQLAVQDGSSKEKRLEGFICKPEDWHACVNFLQIVFCILFKSTSEKDTATFAQLQRIINRRDVTGDVKKNVAAHEEFLCIVTDAYVASSCMDYLKMNNLTDIPEFSKSLNIVETSDLSDVRRILSSCALEIVDNYILRNWKEELVVRDKLVSDDSGKFQCRIPGCEKSFSKEKSRHNHEIKNQGYSGQLEAAANPTGTTETEGEDFINSYSTVVMKLGFLYRNFCDAVREGDEERVCRLWKFLTLHYFTFGHKKYALEGFMLTSRLCATLSKRKAEQLTWNRFANTRGGPGKNVSLDLYIEHLNNETKHYLKKLGANLTDASAIRCSRAAGITRELMISFDKNASLKAPYGRHARRNDTDDFKDLITEIFTKTKATAKIPGRCHTAFPNFSSDVLHRFDVSKFCSWIRTRSARYGYSTVVKFTLYFCRRIRT